MPVADSPRHGTCAAGSKPRGDTLYKAAVICASDRCFRGLCEDKSSPIVVEMLTCQGYALTAAVLLPDEVEALQEAMARIADAGSADVIITTGGTGLAPRDVTPEATAAVIDCLVPGIAEAMRAQSMKITPNGMLSRGIAGIRKRTLIINLPGSPKAVRENLACILPALGHALSALSGSVSDFVYETDAKIGKNVEICASAPEGSHKKVIYPVGVVKESKQVEEAQKFVDFLFSDAAKEVFARYGFTVI